MKNDLLSLAPREKLQEVLRYLKPSTKSELARALEVDYRQIHRWLDEGLKPSRAYEKEIDELFRRHVDLSPEVLKRVKPLRDPLAALRNNAKIREEFFVQMIYHSNAIEGNPMTVKDTRAVIHGQVVRGPNKDVAAHMEVVNHRNAIQHLLKTVERGFRITEQFILKLNALVISGFVDQKPGEYRDGYVNLTNTDVITPSAQEVPKRMKELVAGMSRPHANPIAKAALDHYHFEVIHPFFDGNGRTGRLILMAQLLSRGLPPSIIRLEDRYKYYTGLERCNLRENLPLINTVAEGVWTGYRLLAERSA